MLYSEEKNVKCFFWNKNEKLFQIDSNSDLKKKTWLEEELLVSIIWVGNARVLNMPESAEIFPNDEIYISICVTLWRCVLFVKHFESILAKVLNMPESA